MHTFASMLVLFTVAWGNPVKEKPVEPFPKGLVEEMNAYTERLADLMKRMTAARERAEREAVAVEIEKHAAGTQAVVLVELWRAGKFDEDDWEFYWEDEAGRVRSSLDRASSADKVHTLAAADQLTVMEGVRTSAGLRFRALYEWFQRNGAHSDVVAAAEKILAEFPKPKAPPQKP